MKHTKLNMRGFSHDVLLVAFVVVFAVAGVGYVVASHAASCANKNSWGNNHCYFPATKNTVQRAADPNPDDCNAKTYVKKAMPAGNTLGGLYNYYSNTNKNGQLVKDHRYTLKRDDAAFAKLGYCYESTEGYALSSHLKGTVTLWEFTNGKQHYYTINKQDAPAGYHLQGKVAFVEASIPATDHTQAYGHSAVYEGMYRFVNPGDQTVGAHYFYTINGAPANSSNVQKLNQSYGYTENPQTPVFFVWTNPGKV